MRKRQNGCHATTSAAATSYSAGRERLHYFLTSGVVIAALALASMAPAIGAEPAIPPLAPLVQPPSQHHAVGKVIFAELAVPDLAAAKRFYGELFGWTFQDAQAGAVSLSQASVGNQVVATLIQRELPPGGRRQPTWLTVLSVRDTDAAEAVAVQQGAKLLFGPRDIPNLGRQAGPRRSAGRCVRHSGVE